LQRDQLLFSYRFTHKEGVGEKPGQVKLAIPESVVRPVVVGDTRKCLICDGVFTRMEAAEHAVSLCLPQEIIPRQTLLSLCLGSSTLLVSLRQESAT
jgi:hypothetical protein